MYLVNLASRRLGVPFDLMLFVQGHGSDRFAES